MLHESEWTREISGMMAKSMSRYQKKRRRAAERIGGLPPGASGIVEGARSNSDPIGREGSYESASGGGSPTRSSIICVEETSATFLSE